MHREHNQASLRSDQRSRSPDQVFTFLRNKRSPSPECEPDSERSGEMGESARDFVVEGSGPRGTPSDLLTG